MSTIFRGQFCWIWSLESSTASSPLAMGNSTTMRISTSQRTVGEPATTGPVATARFVPTVCNSPILRVTKKYFHLTLHAVFIINPITDSGARSVMNPPYSISLQKYVVVSTTSSLYGML